ncbi:hypothetical protein FEM48_Zijuj06G0202000 [Ziziphus jujuba var. spinosa]|nr:hypothetical protein FEM48_Zijuj06G0202000 [Ziziphus jujuba var. spinosa]
MMGGELVWCAALIMVALVSSAIVVVGAAESEIDGMILRVDVIHRDSTMSPMYSPSQTHWQRVTNALQRSNHHRHHHRIMSSIKSSSSPSSSEEAAAEAGVLYGKGEYLMNISIGTPPVRVIGIIDTGSDLVWTQCKPCLNCFPQKDPLFDPSSSSTNRVLSCDSKPCKFIREDTSCSSSPAGKFCNYTYTYGDGSFTTGNLSTDTLTLRLQQQAGSTSTSISFPNIIFGCGHHNEGVFGGIESGIVGLGRGPLSLVSQMASSSSAVDGKKFSYCLVNPLSSRSNSSSKMVFGENPMLSGPEVLSTPLLTNASETYYYLQVEAISVGHKKFDFQYSNNNSNSSFKGNILIDSGTTYTFMPPELYKGMDSAIRRAIKLEVAEDPTNVSSLCFRTKSDIIVDDASTVTFHFKGADVKLSSSNTFLRVQQDIVCFAFIPVDDIAIYGNIAQMDYLIGYDLDKELLYFKPTDCTSH